MEELPYFFNLLKNNRLIYTAVTNGKLSDNDLLEFDHTRKDKNAVTLKNFVLNEHEQFNEVVILMSGFGVLIEFITHDTKYFENALLYFNTDAVARSKPAYITNQQTFAVKGKRISKFDIFLGTVHGVVMQSDLYGCKIMASFHADTMDTGKRNATEAEFINSIHCKT